MSVAPAPSDEVGAVPELNPAPRTRPFFVIAVTILFDVLMAGLSVVIAFRVRTWFGYLSMAPYLRLVPGLLLLPVAYTYAGLYPGYGVGPVEKLRRMFRSTTLVALLTVGATFLFKTGNEISRAIIVIWWLLIVILMPLERALLRELFSRKPWWGQPVLVLGAAKTGQEVVRRLKANPGLGLRPVAFLDDDLVKHGMPVEGIPVLGALRLAPEVAQRYRISMAVVAMPGLNRQRLTRVVEEHAATFPQVLIIPDLLGLNSLWVTARDLQGVLGLELRQNHLSAWNRCLKRCLDLAVTVPALLVAGPIILLAAWAIKINSPGSAFYSQDREGLDGRRIRVWKLRTMVPNAEAVLQTYLAQNPAARQEWDTYMKLKDDPRIVPRVGSFLRRFSLDELPQLWNIVRGDMSLVGPRPFPDYHLSRFPQTFRRLRHKVKPGLTGLWQVTARSDGDLAVQEELDTYYIRNWSLWLDIYLLARTVTAVLFGKGAY